MKKIFLLVTAIFFTSLIGLKAQNYNVNPIPSYQYPLNNQVALFGEIRVSNSKEKRDMDVEISTANHGSAPVYATVWVVKKNGNVVKGPYFVTPYDPLSVPIDNDKWGVIVKCDWNVFVDVWTNK